MILQRCAKHQREGRPRGVQRLKSRAAETASINDGPSNQHAEFGRRVNASAPEAAADGVEIFGMLPREQRLSFAVAMLLLQVSPDGRTPIMPNKCGRTESNLVMRLLQSPAYIHVVASPF